MNNIQIENLVLAWLALDASPDAPRPFGPKARDGLLAQIADFFSVKPAPLAAYLRYPEKGELHANVFTPHPDDGVDGVEYSGYWEVKHERPETQ